MLWFVWCCFCLRRLRHHLRSRAMESWHALWWAWNYAMIPWSDGSLRSLPAMKICKDLLSHDYGLEDCHLTSIRVIVASNMTLIYEFMIYTFSEHSIHYMYSWNVSLLLPLNSLFLSICERQWKHNSTRPSSATVLNSVHGRFFSLNMYKTK